MDGKSRKEGRSSKKGLNKLKKKLLEKEGFVEPHEVNHICSEKEDGPEFMKEDEQSTADREKKRVKSMTRKKMKKDKGTEVADGEVYQLGYEDEDGSNDVKSGGITGIGKAKKLSQSKKQIKVNGKAKKSSQSKKQIKVDSVESNEAHAGTDVAINRSKKAGKSKKKDHVVSKKERVEKKAEVEEDEVYHMSSGDEDCSKGMKIDRSKKAGKSKKKDRVVSKKERVEKKAEVEEDEVYQMSSGDEDCSKGMKKWITEYHRSRPGLKILQQRIDDFTTAHEAQEEQAKKERESRIAEGGWTVVKHHKGRKKTTDSESGVAVGAVAEAAVLDKMTQKKKKGVALNFYNFQRREAQRNEVITLQSKFEQDKKRIQQMRAARKFRPY